MTANPGPARRRRPRRGSLERPVNGRLYRSALLVLALPLLVLAFSITRPGPLPAPLLPPNFDGPSTTELASELATKFPDRAPDTAGALGAVQWFRDALAPYGLPITTDTWHATLPAIGRVRLQNVWAVAAGESRDAIVVMAHRDDTGVGPGANDDASGTAALVELARGYAQAGTPAAQRVRSEDTIVFLSTDGGAFGSVGAARFVQHTHLPIVATINLDAIAGSGPPRLVLNADTPRSPPASLVVTASRRVLEQTGRAPRRSSVGRQLLDLAFPFSLYEQAPFVSHGIPAITLTTAGDRPPAAFTDRVSSLDGERLATLGRAAQELIGSLDQGLSLGQGPTSFVWLGNRAVRGWAIELLLFGLLVPWFVAVVDLFAHCRRRGIPLLPALQSLRSRIVFWLFVGVAFYVFRFFGAWPSWVDRPPNPSLPASGDWPAAALIGLGAVAFGGWLVARDRLVPRREVTVEERLAGETAALLGLGVISLLVLATNPYSLIFVLPALHAWLWLPQVRNGRFVLRALVYVVGLAGPAVLIASFAVRYGLGFDAPWYLVELTALGWVHISTAAITLALTGCAAQLAVVSAGRYAPYPRRGERRDRGPIRELIRRLVLLNRERRRVLAERARSAGS